MAEHVILSKKVRYSKEAYGIEGLLGVRCWNAGVCFIAIVAKMGGANDWAAYVGALPNQRLVNERTREDVSSTELLAGSLHGLTTVVSTTEEEVVRYTCSYGGKLRAEEAAALFKLPVEQYRR